jgi:hypothetical protein
MVLWASRVRGEGGNPFLLPCITVGTFAAHASLATTAGGAPAAPMAGEGPAGDCGDETTTAVSHPVQFEWPVSGL